MDERYELWADWTDGKGNAGSKPSAYVCRECGSLVTDQNQHDLWHLAFDDLRSLPHQGDEA